MVVIIVLSTIERRVEKLESTGTVQNVHVPVRQKSARSVENIAVEESPNVALTRRSQALGISVRRCGEFSHIILAYFLQNQIDARIEAA